MMRETDCGHCHICHGLLTILKRIENCSLFVSERIEPATCWRHLSNDKTLLVFTEVVASITTYYLFLNTIYSIKTKMCWLLVCYALLGVFATSQTQTVGSSNLCELSEGICMNGGTCVQQGEEIGNMNIACYCVQGFTGIICQDLDAIEPLTCFTCGVDGTTCETGSFSNKTCLQDQICVILNFNISLADGGSLALILRDCENPENVPANSCLSAQEYFGPGNNFTVEGTACYCNTDLCLGPISNTEDSLTTSRIFTEIATKEILQSTSQVEELRTMISAVDNVDKSASNDSFPIFSTNPDILPATLLTTPSTNLDAISDLFTELTSVTDGIWISETPQKEETSTFSSPTTSEGSLQTTSNISAPNSIVTSEKDSGDVVRCLLCTQIDGNGDCSDSDGYQTCGSGGEVCIVVNVTMISSRLDFVVQQTSAGCVDQTILEFSTTNGCISISEYIDVFQLDFSTQNSTGIVCLCDPEDFCNNITTLLTSSGQTSISSSTAASGQTSISSSTAEKAECYDCNGELACTSPSVPVVTCSTGQICVAVNISIGNDRK
ncbi:uncharacterized protein [Apostichopus japonicus]|uniref:uncharacterized protein n=1 Tax=Stichopus japonicus TaxID=307972 RepID=UPI003AB42A73